MSQDDIYEQQRIYALQEFYEFSKSNSGMLELTYVNAVSAARVICRDKLRKLSSVDFRGDSKWEKVLFDFYERVSDELLDGKKSFLFLAPFVRRLVAETSENLEVLIQEMCFSSRGVISDPQDPPIYIQAEKLILVNVKAGDILVVITDDHFSEAGLLGIKERFLPILPPGVQVIVLDSPLSFSVIRPTPEPRDEHG